MIITMSAEESVMSSKCSEFGFCPIPDLSIFVQRTSFVLLVVKIQLRIKGTIFSNPFCIKRLFQCAPLVGTQKNLQNFSSTLKSDLCSQKNHSDKTLRLTHFGYINKRVNISFKCKESARLRKCLNVHFSLRLCVWLFLWKIKCSY